MLKLRAEEYFLICDLGIRNTRVPARMRIIHRHIGIKISGHGPRKLHISNTLGDSDRWWSSRTAVEEAVESGRNGMVAMGQRSWLGESGLKSDSAGTRSAVPDKGAWKPRS